MVGALIFLPRASDLTTPAAVTASYNWTKRTGADTGTWTLKQAAAG